MKLSTTFISAMALVLAASFPSRANAQFEHDFGMLRHNGNGNGNGGEKANGNGNSKWNGPLDHVPAHVLEKFNQRNQVKNRGRGMFYQDVVGESVRVGDQDISLRSEDLTPVNIMSKKSRIVIDGIDALCDPLVFESKQDSSVLITRDVHGKLVSASKRGEKGRGRGNNMDIIPVDGDVYATVDEEDLDQEALKQFILGEDHNPGLRARQLRSISKRQEQRSLSSVWDVIELDVIVDSYYCNSLGSSADATAKAQSIVARASMDHYADHGIKIEIKNLIVYCDPGNDPMRPILDSGAPVCGGGGTLMEQFKNHVQDDPSLDGDLVHLFYGKDVTGTSTIGCAYIGALCSSSGWNTGIDEMSFSGNLMSQGRLLAHEMGHNLGANHYPISGYLMYGSICSSCTFSSSSIDTFTATISSAPSGCIHQESEDPTPAPTPAPTTAPDPTPSPVDAPNNDCQDTFFWLRVNGQGPYEGCPWVADSGRASWYCANYDWIAAYCPATCELC